MSAGYSETFSGQKFPHPLYKHVALSLSSLIALLFKELPVATSIMSLELFVLSWGIYPRRVLIYLAERGLLNSLHLKITPVILSGATMTASGKPPGTLPILSLGNGHFIKQSIAVLEYFEDICDAAKISNSTDTTRAKLGLEGGPSMRGDTPDEKARTRQILGLTG